MDRVLGTLMSGVAAHEAVDAMEDALRGPSARTRNVAGHAYILGELAPVIAAASTAATALAYVLRKRDEDNGAFRQLTNAARHLRKGAGMTEAATSLIARKVLTLRGEGSPSGTDLGARQSLAVRSAIRSAEAVETFARELSAESKGSRRSDGTAIQDVIGYLYWIACDLDNSLLVESRLVEGAYTEAGAGRVASATCRSLCDAAMLVRKGMSAVRVVRDTRAENMRAVGRPA